MSETRAQQDLQVLSPRSSRPCQESKLTLEIRVGTNMYWKIFCEDDHLARITEEVAEFGEISTAGVSVSEFLGTSHLQSQMNMRGSVGSSADSDPEDGELQKCSLRQNTCWKLWGQTDAMVVQEGEERAQYTQADRKES